jgi:hypothetical protein
MLAIVLSPLPVVAQGLSDETQVHGLVSQGYMHSTDNNYLANTADGTFEFNEAIVNFSTQVSENLRVGLQLLSRDLGKEGNNSVTLDWAYGDYRWRKNLGLRFGKLKFQMGFYNKGRDVDMLRTSILLPQAVYDETTREFLHSYNGFSLHGRPLLPKVGRLSYELYVGTLPIRDPNSNFWQNNLRIVINSMDLGILKSFGYTLDLESLAAESVTVERIFGGMLMWNTPLPGLRVAGNLFKGELEGIGRVELQPLDPNAAEDASLTNALQMDLKIDKVLTLSAEYSRGDLLLAGELLSTRFDMEFDMTLGKTGITLPDIPAKMEWQGYYAMATYRLSDLLEVGSYYTKFYPNKNDKNGEKLVSQGEPRFRAWKEDIALSTRFDMGENWLLKLEAHRMDGTAQVMVHENLGGLERNWHLFLAKISCHF